METYKNIHASETDYGTKAKELFFKGYNCAQAVFCAFADQYGLDTQTAYRISSSFGGGMGRMREVCGSVSGMFMAAGLIYGYSPDDPKNAKGEHYKLIQYLAEEFKKRNDKHSIICREILGIGDKKESYIPEERTAEYYKKRPCADRIYDAADILSQYIKNHKPVR